MILDRSPISNTVSILDSGTFVYCEPSFTLSDMILHQIPSLDAYLWEKWIYHNRSHFGYTVFTKVSNIICMLEELQNPTDEYYEKVLGINYKDILSYMNMIDLEDNYLIEQPVWESLWDLRINNNRKDVRKFVWDYVETKYNYRNVPRFEQWGTMRQSIGNTVAYLTVKDLL